MQTQQKQNKVLMKKLVDNKPLPMSKSIKKEPKPFISNVKTKLSAIKSIQ